MITQRQRYLSERENNGLLISIPGTQIMISEADVGNRFGLKVERKLFNSKIYLAVLRQRAKTMNGSHRL